MDECLLFNINISFNTHTCTKSGNNYIVPHKHFKFYYFISKFNFIILYINLNYLYLILSIYT